MDDTQKTKELPEEQGKRLGRYRVVTKVGEGAMGTVYKAYDTSLERVVALKVLSKRSSTDAITVQRFIREAKMTAKLHHPNIVTLYEFEQIAGAFCLVMDFIDGKSLEQMLQDDKCLPIQQTCELLLGILDAIHYAHQQGIVHRDIKPSNILINREGRPFVTDFGIAKALAPDSDFKISHTGEMLGTLAYMSPEQAQDTKHSTDVRSDVYSLGVMMYKMLTGKLPIDVENPFAMMYKLANAKVQNPRKLDPQIPAELDYICMKALSKEKSARYQSATEMASEIRAFLGQDINTATPMPARSENHAAQWMEWYQENRRIVFLCALLMVMGFITSLILRSAGRETNKPLAPDNKQGIADPKAGTDPKNGKTQVRIKIVPVYNPMPPANYARMQVVFKAANQSPRSVSLDDAMAPGNYQLSVVLPGYDCDENGKMIEVRAVQLFHLSLHLNAVPREINPRIRDTQSGEQVLPLVFQIDQKPVVGNRFRPGQAHLYALFENHQEISTTVQIPVGEEIFQYESALVSLQELWIPLKEILAETSHVHKAESLSYDLEIHIDDKQLRSPHFQYQIQNGDIHARLRIPPYARKIVMQSGFYFTAMPLSQIAMLRRLNQIEVNALIKHLSMWKDNNEVFAKELDSLVSKDKEKLGEMSADAQQKLHQFLAKLTKNDDGLDSGIWQLRRLLRREEAEEYAAYLNCLRAAGTLSFSEKTNLWLTYVRRYPQGVYTRQAQSYLDYYQEGGRYEQLFRESLKDCFLSLGEKRTLRHWETKIKPEDVTAVRKKMAERVKELNCGQNLEQMMQDR